MIGYYTENTMHFVKNGEILLGTVVMLVEVFYTFK